jgi:hypothetical protein
MVDVPNRPDVAMRLVPRKLLFGHRTLRCFAVPSKSLPRDQANFA